MTNKMSQFLFRNYEFFFFKAISQICAGIAKCTNEKSRNVERKCVCENSGIKMEIMRIVESKTQ
jgi:hypothetical protein